MTRPIICAIGISHRDVELATLWLRWVSFLTRQEGGGVARGTPLLIMCTQRAFERSKEIGAATHPDGYDGHNGMFTVHLKCCTDECEDGYPKSASHLFLRTLERAESLFPSHAVLWCEADTVPMKPSWFAEIAAEYQTCGKPFLGVTVGKQTPQMSGIGVYGAQWRMLAPKLANVLSAPDISGHGKGKGCAWDVWARDQTYPQMAESKLLRNDWKHRQARPTRLAEIAESVCLYHQEKSPALIIELAAARYPEFLKQIAPAAPRYFMMNGHESRLRANGFKVSADKKRHGPGGWTAVFTTEGKSTENATVLAGLVGMFGFREITKEDYDAVP